MADKPTLAQTTPDQGNVPTTTPEQPAFNPAPNQALNGQAANPPAGMENAFRPFRSNYCSLDNMEAAAKTVLGSDAVVGERNRFFAASSADGKSGIVLGSERAASPMGVGSGSRRILGLAADGKGIARAAVYPDSAAEPVKISGSKRGKGTAAKLAKAYSQALGCKL